MKRELAIAMLLVGTARADRRTADQLFRDAEAERDPAKFEACGKAYIDVVAADATAPSNDEVLYDAAVCFTAAHAAGAADQALRQLVARYPNSKFSGRAILQLGQIAEVTGRLDEAAARFEDYAKKYAGEKDAYDALHNAFVYRAVLGDDANAIADANYFARTFGTKQQREAAAIMLQLVPIYERQGGALAFVDGLVKSYGRVLDESQLAIAMAKLGELRWDATCKGRALCVTELPHDKLPRCGDGVRLRVDKRTATADAEASLEAAAKFFEQRQPKDPAARHAYAMTKLRQADRALEAYLAVGFPSGLDFSPKTRAKSLERFNHYVQDKVKLGGLAQRAYEEVLALKDADSSIAAAARIGQTSASFAASLRTAEIPADVRSGEFAKERKAAFCDKITEVAEPLAARALEAFAVCRQKSIELGVDTAWTAVCRREAAVLDSKLVVDEPQLGPLVPIHPQPWYVPAPRPTKQDPAYAAAFEAADKAPCPKLAAPTSDRGRYLAALVAARCGRTDEAMRGFEVLPGAAALANRGSLYWNTGDGPHAIEAWESAVKLDGKLAVPHYGLALARFADPAHDKEVQLDLLNASVADPEAAGPKIMLALFELRRGRPLIAQLYLSRVQQESPALHVARAVLRARDARFADAQLPLEEADKEHWPQAGYDLALLALRRHDYEAAAARLRGVKPGYDALVALGVAQAGLGKPADARASFEAAIALDAARPEAHFDLGLALAAQARFHDAAAELDLAKATALADRYRKLP